MAPQKSESGTVLLRAAEAGRHAALRDACLILIHPAGPDLGRRIPLEQGEYILGRVHEADIVVPRESVSRQHARLFHGASGWTVEDLDSTNGCWVNEVRVVQQGLTDGDQLRIGDAIYKFLTGANVESSYHEEIYRMAILDGLTGVHNKRYLLEFLDREISGHLRRNQPLSLVLFDIDHFKTINDERGHLAGDAVLKQLAGRLEGRMRREDLFARYGGEEFAAVLTASDLRGARTFAETMRHAVSGADFQFENEKFPVTVSLGIACTEGDSDVTPDSLIARADEKLYAAKRAGRNRTIA